MQPKLTLTENALFEEWAKKRTKFSRDGIADEKLYLESNPRILYLLKEVNAKEGFDLREFIAEGGRNRTWTPIARWTHGIRNIDRDLSWKEVETIRTNDQRIALNSSLCAVNLKKSAGSHTTNPGELWTVASEDKEYLNRQFNIYMEDACSTPDLIIGCGTDACNTFHDLIELPRGQKWQRTKRGIDYYQFAEKSFFIQYAHPEARVADNILYYGLIDAIRTIQKKNAT